VAFSGWPRHGIRASLIAPLAAPLIFWLRYLAAVDGLPAILAFGSVIAYGAMLTMGLPALALLALFNALTLFRTLALGIAAGLAVAHVFQVGQQGALFPVMLPYWLGGVIGAGCAALWWRLASPERSVGA
jgi:hypothetical protein